jgi:hypothetical protein
VQGAQVDKSDDNKIHKNQRWAQGKGYNPNATDARKNRVVMRAMGAQRQISTGALSMAM